MPVTSYNCKLRPTCLASSSTGLSKLFISSLKLLNLDLFNLGAVVVSSLQFISVWSPGAIRRKRLIPDLSKRVIDLVDLSNVKVSLATKIDVSHVVASNWAHFLTIMGDRTVEIILSFLFDLADCYRPDQTVFLIFKFKFPLDLVSHSSHVEVVK